jgi:hypothetical protein
MGVKIEPNLSAARPRVGGLPMSVRDRLGSPAVIKVEKGVRSSQWTTSC